MSTIQHINSSLDHFWPEYQRRFPAFDKPEIVPAETLRGMAPIYMRRLIDQDPSSYYLFVHADPMRGDASRDRMVEFVDDFFYNKLGMPSSYDIEAGQGGDLPREQAVDKEVMPARDDSEYRRYFDEQMAAVDAQRREQERQKRIDDLGFDPDDGNTIDVDVGDDGVAKSASDTRAVGQAQTTTVGMPKKIWFCVDFHCPAGGMLGYSGGAGGRLGGGRGGRRFLREADTGTPISDILRAYEWAKTTTQGSTSLVAGLEAIAKAKAADDATGQNAAIHRDFNLYIFKYSGGRTTWIEEEVSRPGNFSITWSNITDALSQDWARRYQTVQATVVTIDELRRMTTVAEDKESDPEKMMKEFIEKKENGEIGEDEYRRPKNQPHNLHQVDEGEVEEDEYRRPKNQPHNLHQVDESDAWVADIDADGQDDVQFIVYASSEEDARKEAENEIKSHKLKNAKVKSVRLKDEKSKDDGDIEDAEDFFDEDESQFELNESMVRFCDRLIRG